MLKDQTVSPRAVVIGLSLVVLVNIWVPYASYIHHSSRLTLAHLPLGAFLPFLIMLLLGSLAHRFGGEKLGLSPAELGIILSMLLVATTIAGRVFISLFLSLISAPFYFASPENRWVESFFDYLPRWLIVNDQGDALRGFYEGLSEGQTISWANWILPIIWWMTFLGALFMVGASIITILRKQWVENERLVFPLARVPLEMVRTTEKGSLPVFLKKRLFWTGFAVVFFILGWNMIGYFTLTPKIPIGATFTQDISLGRYYPPIPARINIYTLCFAFFTDVNILFSIWFFYLFGVVESGIINRIGMGTGSGIVGSDAVVDAQNFGGFILFILAGLWVARHHLKGVILTALGKPGGEDDSKEFFSYRAAVFVFILGTLYMIFWLCAAGMSFPVVLFLLFVLLITYTGVTRVVAETGLVFLGSPVSANVFTVNVLGSSTLSPRTLTTLALGHTFAGRGFGMSALAHIGKITTELKVNKKRIFILVSIALVITLITSISYTIYIGYKMGSLNFGDWAFRGAGPYFWNQVVHWMRNPTSISHTEITFSGIGVILVSMLFLLRYRFPWWPLHPIGFVIGYADVVHVSATSIFLAWLVKSIILKVGGIELYRRAQFFFLGMLAAHAIGTFLSFLVDVIWFPGRGHTVHTW